MCVCVCCRYRLAGLPGDYQEKNISSPETNYCLLKDLIIWTQYQIQVAAFTGAGLGSYSSPVTEYTLQGGEHTLAFMIAGCAQCICMPAEFKRPLSTLFILAPCSLVALVFIPSLNCVFVFSGNARGVKHTHWDFWNCCYSKQAEQEISLESALP